MLHKVCDLDGDLLDAAVAKVLGYDWRAQGLLREVVFANIIDREQITTAFLSVEDVDEEEPRGAWCAFVSGAGAEPGHYIDTYPDNADAQGPTHTVAAMRAWITVLHGPEIELP